MIRYALKCANGHDFESWFQSADAFDGLAARGLVECPECGDTSVSKAMMAPRVSAEPETPTDPAAALRALKRRIEAESEYVGMRFAEEARAIHEGDAPERAIYGEARPDEAKKLIEDGVPVAPLPFIPTRKTN